MDQVINPEAPTPSKATRNRNEQLNCNIDIDLLECPICTEGFSSPLFQCENGHPLCSTCHRRVANCPFCWRPMRNIRCLAVEKLMDSMEVRCAHARRGCNQLLKYSAREDHVQNSCAYRPCPCPVPGCASAVPRHELSRHLRAHAVQTFPLSQRNLDSGSRDWSAVLRMSARCRFAMVECCYTSDVQLLVHREISALGEVFFCTSLAGASLVYELKVKNSPDEQHHCVALRGATTADVRREEDWRIDALVFSRGSGNAEVVLRINLEDAVMRGRLLVRRPEA